MLDTNALLVIGIILLAVIAFRPTAAPAAAAAAPAPAPAPQVIVMPARGGDDRYTRAPEPLRQDGIPLPSIRTRGEPDPYQQMGTLTVDGKVHVFDLHIDKYHPIW